MTRRMVTLCLVLGLLVVTTIVVAQPGQGGRGGRNRFGGMLMGKITAANVAAGTIEVEAWGRPMTLYPVQATRLTKFEPVAIADLKVGETLEVTGLPLKIQADRLRAPLPVATEGQPGAAGGPPAAMAAFGMADRGGRVTGTIKTVKPLVVTVASPDGQGAGTDVEVVTSDATKLTREVAATWNEVAAGVTFRATGDMNEQQQLVLQSLTLDPEIAEMLQAMPAMGGPGGGPGGAGPGGGRGGRGGGN